MWKDVGTADTKIVPPSHFFSFCLCQVLLKFQGYPIIIFQCSLMSEVDYFRKSKFHMAIEK